MFRIIKRQIWRCYVKIDSLLKFPNLKHGEIGIQIGFDMGSPVTSDLFTMSRRVGLNGQVIGIDPDFRNIQLADVIIKEQKYNIILIHKAVYSEKGICDLLLGESESWNQLNNVPVDSSVQFTGEKVSVEMDSLDNIVDEQKIDITKIGHINMTINGAEYYALKGMHNILSMAGNINLTIVAGRFDESGVINGKPDNVAISDLLKHYGFVVKFKRINHLIWWGFFVKAVLNRKWIYGKKNYGVIFASKGKKKIKWYQSFS